MKRVTGLGGVFYKCRDKEKMLAWYKKHLEIPAEEWGAIFSPAAVLEAHPKVHQVWSLMKEDSKYFEPSKGSFMINFTVEDLDNLIPLLRSEGVEVLDKSEESEFGKFAWILDPEGNKIELWEPPK